MSIEAVRAYLSRWNRDKDIIEMDVSTATVELAASALGVIPALIAKSISLRGGGSPDGGEGTGGNAALLVVTAGDMKLDNRKFKERFGFKARMLNPEEALRFTGHAVGGVCPFALPPGVEVYLDVSMKRFQTMYPACGSGNSAIELTLAELEEYSQSKAWVDVCQMAG
ncbi:MAG: YbaK/EbsC family protein [Spirochaetaceae bacterium]|jgi:prolyl-tRNA editing enzyme YbaK/EbsC (Cys-tRNA(Pro) deacylase)|nr:YbaK/EbsC family protein [Spirochaetaceae bacterium]